jgi:membrane protease YdiL (CAAX protease family)
MFASVLKSGNHIFDLARTSRRLLPVWLAVLLSIGFIFIGQVIGSLPLLLLLGLGAMPTASTPVGMSLVFLLFFVITLTPTGILLFLWLRFVEKRTVSTLGLEKPGAWKKYLRGLATGAALFSIIVLLLWLPGFVGRQAPAFGLPALLLGALIALPAWAWQSALEEIVVRGWLMPVIGARTGRTWLALLITSLLFAVLHLLNPGTSVLSTVNIALAGLVFGLLVLLEGGIWGACGLHAAWNWIQGTFYGFPTSGNAFSTPTVLGLFENGPDVLTGGSFGPEGGLAATVVLIAAAAVLGWLIHRRNSLAAQEA